eukprot:g26303.t1
MNLLSRRLVPNLKLDSVGSRQSAFAPRISIEEMYVARAGDTASSINVGIQGKKGLLLTPGLYEVGEPIMVTDPGFVILGLGFPTLVSKGALPAIMQMADDARVAGILLEGGAEVDEIPRTDALLLWSGHGGVASDIFARSFRKPKTVAAHQSSIAVVHVGVFSTKDHTWLWHADHDDCTSRWPDSLSAVSCQSQNALLVRGKRVIIYGLQAEHTLEDQVVWYGEEGKVFFYQNELPYIDPYFRLPGSNFGTRFVSYRVAENGVNAAQTKEWRRQAVPSHLELTHQGLDHAAAQLEERLSGADSTLEPRGAGFRRGNLELLLDLLGGPDLAAVPVEDVRAQVQHLASLALLSSPVAAHLVGSRLYGAALPDADIDLVLECGGRWSGRRHAPTGGLE